MLRAPRVGGGAQSTFETTAGAVSCTLEMQRAFRQPTRHRAFESLPTSESWWFTRRSAEQTCSGISSWRRLGFKVSLLEQIQTGAWGAETAPLEIIP